MRQNLALAYGLKGDMKMAMKVGSKDLTAQQMNENIRFYALVTKRGIKHDGPSYAASEPADVFPTIAPPPTPIAEIPASEDAPPITGLTGEAAQPVAADAPPPAIAVPGAPQQVAALPAEPVRNLSPAPQVASPALIYGPAPATPGVKPVVEKIIKPEPQPDVTTARRKAPTIQPTETDDDSTTTASDTAPPATDGIPVPVLKPDKW